MADGNGVPVSRLVDPKTVWLPPSQMARHTGEKYRQLVDSITLQGLVSLPVLLEIASGSRGDGWLFEAVAGVGRIMGWIEAFPGRQMPAFVRKDCDPTVTGVENLIRADWTPWEVSRYFKGLLDGGMPQAEIARRHSYDRGLVSTHLKVMTDGIPALIEAYEGGLIPFTSAAFIARQPAEKQHSLIDEARNGTKRDDLVRRNRKPKSQAATVSRIKIDLPSSVKVVLSGKNLTLDAAIEAAGDAGKLMEKGRKDGLTAKTISKVSAERAKAGG